MAGRGRELNFHGAFRSKEAATRKEASVRGGFILKRRISGKRGGKGERRQRWLVVSAR